MRVLVTGGGGFLGAKVAEALCVRGDDVTVLGHIRADTPVRKEVKQSIHWVNGDIKDKDLIQTAFADNRIDSVVHAAAIVGGPQTIGMAEDVAEVNILGSLNVLSAAVRAGVGRYLEMSSAELYGDFKSEPLSEDARLDPITPYGISKLASEQFALFHSRYFGLDVRAVRTSWVYGPGLKRNRIPRNLIKDALDKGRIELQIGGDHRMDHVYIDDLVQGTLLALDADKPKHRVYNITSGKSFSVREVAGIIQEIIPGVEAKIGGGLLDLDAAKGLKMARKGAMDCTRAKEDLGYHVKYELRAGLASYVDYLRANEF